jgi:hypothetical protein
MNGKRFAAVLLVVAALASAFSLITRAQEPDGPALPLNEYGTPDMSQIELTPAGHYEECVAYCTSVPVVGEVGVTVEYDLYTDNYGNTWVVPSPLTVLVTAAYPEYTPAGLAGRMDGWGYGSLLMGMIDAIRDAADMEGDHLRFMLRLGQALAESGGTDGFLGTGLEIWQISWVYSDNPFDPGDDERGTPQPTRTPRPTPTRQPTPARR